MNDDQARNVQQYEYDSFGNQHDMKNRIKQPYGYMGREHDRETGLRYYTATSYCCNSFSNYLSTFKLH